MTRAQRIRRSFNRWGIFAALIALGFALFAIHVARDPIDLWQYAQFTIIIISATYGLVSFVGRIIAAFFRNKDEPPLTPDEKIDLGRQINDPSLLK